MKQWSMHCPRCRHLITKEHPLDDWVCRTPNCGWTGGDDVSRTQTQQAKKERR